MEEEAEGRRVRRGKEGVRRERRRAMELECGSEGKSGEGKAGGVEWKAAGGMRPGGGRGGGGGAEESRADLALHRHRGWRQFMLTGKGSHTHTRGEAESAITRHRMWSGWIGEGVAWWGAEGRGGCEAEQAAKRVG
jgi:hypothetical protein